MKQTFVSIFIHILSARYAKAKSSHVLDELGADNALAQHKTRNTTSVNENDSRAYVWRSDSKVYGKVLESVKWF
jgi:hypothetical protein